MLSKILLPLLGLNIGLAVTVLSDSSFYRFTFLLASLGLLGIFILLNTRLNSKKIFMAIMILDMDLLIDYHLFSHDDLLTSVPGIHISLMTVSLMVLYVLWWIDIITKKSRTIDFSPKFNLLVLFYILSFLLSIINSTNIWLSIFSIIFLAQMFLMSFYIINTIQSREDVSFIVNILIGCLTIQSSVIIIEYLSKSQFSFTDGFSSGDTLSYFLAGKTTHLFRPSGTGKDSNDAGAHIAILILIITSLFVCTHNFLKKILLIIVLLVSTAALILTFSRGAWLSVVAGLIIYFSAALRHHWISIKRIISMMLLISIFLAMFSVPITVRLIQDDRGAAYSRVPLMKLSFEMIQNHPFIGVGINNFGIVFPKYLTSELRGEWLYIVHNQYLLTLSETGIIGMAFFILILVNVFFTSLRCVTANDPMLSPLSLGILSGLGALFLLMGFELTISRLTVQLFWIMASIIIALERLIRNNKHQFRNGKIHRTKPLVYKRDVMPVGSERGHGRPI
jgi:putative inorganic carbon (hco3(-)) transporter